MQSSREMPRLTSNHCRMVYNFLYGHLGNRQDAEDLTAEVFLKASRQLDSNLPEESIVERLSTLAHAVLARYLQRYYRHTTDVRPGGAVADEIPMKPAPAGSEAAAEMPVEQILGSLPDQDRRVLQLRLLRGYSIEATARELGMTPESVKMTQYRALAKVTQVAEGVR